MKHMEWFTRNAYASEEEHDPRCDSLPPCWHRDLPEELSRPEARVADGDWIVMRTNAVHSEGELCKIPASPIKSTVNMSLCLEFAIVRTRYVVE